MPPHDPPLPVGTDSFLYDFGDALLYLSAPGIIAFSLFYFFRSNWKSTAAGRSILWLSNSLAAVICLAAFSRFFGPDYPYREWVRIVLYGAVTFAVYRLLITLLWIQHKTPDIMRKIRRRDKEPKT